MNTRTDDFLIRSECPSCKEVEQFSLFNRSFNDNLIQEYLAIEYPGVKDFNIPEAVKFEFVECIRCSLIYQKYVFCEDKIGEVYNCWMDQKEALCDHLATGNWKYEYNERILKYASLWLNKPPNQIRFLDFGAGFGTSLKVALKMGFLTSAIEYSEERINYLTSIGVEIIQEGSQKKFDFIICDQVLEHATYPDQLLKSINRLLAPNGLVYLAVPNCLNFKKNVVAAERITSPIKYHRALSGASIGAFQHINFFTHKSLRATLMANVFKAFLPFQMSILPPLSIKGFCRPFYHRFFSTIFFLYKQS